MTSSENRAAGQCCITVLIVPVGVDLVLNSLSEEKLQASLRCLARHGRFLEIGKYDLSNNTPLGKTSLSLFFFCVRLMCTVLHTFSGNIQYITKLLFQDYLHTDLTSLNTQDFTLLQVTCAQICSFLWHFGVLPLS